MIRISTFYFFLVFSFCWNLSSAQILNWQYTDILTDQHQSGAYPDMVVDADGNFHLSFWDQNEDRLMYGFRDKTTGGWTIETVDPTHSAGYKSAITLDANDQVHIAYYENISGLAYLRYAHNMTGNWVNESVVQDTTLGMYGPDYARDSYVELSLDIAFDSVGQPFISFFDGSIFNTSNCGSKAPFNGAVPDVFSLDLNIAQRRGMGSWQFSNLSYRNRNKPTNCVRSSDDRFGEFCQILPRGDSLLLVTNALYNHELLLLQADAANTASWSIEAIDSAVRVVDELIMYEEGFHFSDAKLIGDSILHLAYGISEAYGQDFTITVPVNGRPGIHRNFFYTQIHLDSLGKGTYTPFHHEFSPLPRDGYHRSFFALDVVENDSIYLAYYNTHSEEIVMTYSEDNGSNWSADTIWQGVATNTRLLCTVVEDSVFVGYYASDRDQLLMASRHRLGDTWRYETITQSHQRGQFLSAVVDRPSVGGDRLHIVFDEKNEDQLYYGSQVSGSWQFEAIGPSGQKAQTPGLALDANKQPVVTFVLGSTGEFHLARFDGSIWHTELVDSTGQAESPQSVIIDDSIHISYIDRSNGSLSYAKSLLGSGNWAITDLDINMNGGFLLPSMKADSLGRLHLAYKQLDGNRLKYARRESGDWAVSFITDSLVYDPAHLDLKIRKKDAHPSIAFQDAISEEIFLAEQSTLGFWGIQSVLKAQGSFVGNPLSLILAEGDTRWILYNYVTSTSEIRLMRRHAWTRDWFPVSVTNNQAEIAVSFEFMLADDDFYIVGKKNALGNGGIGMLYAAEGATTDISSPLTESQSFTLFPNPTHTTCNVDFSLSSPQPVQVSIWNIHAQQQSFICPPKTLPPGNHRIEVNTSRLPSGIYLCKVQIGTVTQVKKLAVYH